MALYVGEVHSNIFGLGTTGIAEAPVRGEYRGQSVKLNSGSKSLIQQADELDDYVVVRRQEKPKLDKRKVKDKKKIAGKNRLLHQFVRRLDKQQGSRQYQDYEARFKRMKQKAIIQMMEKSLHGDEGTEIKLDGRKLSDLILEEAAEAFGEVTEQDNAIEYLEELENYETGEAESELRQADKMIKRLDGRTDEKGITRRKALEEKVNDLQIQVKFSKLFRRELAEAKQILHNAHGQEIKDGYNLIPKATDLFASLVDQKSADSGNQYAKAVAAMYQKVLCAENLVEVMDVCRGDFETKNVKPILNSIIELSGADIKSADPSRDVQYLMSVRDTLFNSEIALQLFQEVGKLRTRVVDTFMNCAKKAFNEETQFSVTKEIVKLSQQSYVSTSQLYNILEGLGVNVGDLQ